MSVKRPPRKAAAPAVMTVPRVRTLRGDDGTSTTEVQEAVATRPRRNRKPKFVF